MLPVRCVSRSGQHRYVQVRTVGASRRDFSVSYGCPRDYDTKKRWHVELLHISVACVHITGSGHLWLSTAAAKMLSIAFTSNPWTDRYDVSASLLVQLCKTYQSCASRTPSLRVSKAILFGQSIPSGGSTSAG